MPNNAGAVDASPTRKIIHLSYIDSDGKLRTDSYDTDNTLVDADVNTLTAALGLTTNASIYAVGITNWFATGQPQKGDADDLTNDSVKDNLVILMKNSSNQSFDFFIPANLESATMVADTETPDPTNPLLEAVVDAIMAIWGGYTPYSYRFTERRQKNRAVKA